MTELSQDSQSKARKMSKSATAPKRSRSISSGKPASEVESAKPATEINPMVDRDVSLLAMAIKASSRTRLASNLMLIVIMLSVLLVAISMMSEDRYFAVDANGRIVPLRDVDSPAAVPGAPSGFVNTVLPELFTFGHINYEDHVYRVIAENFTDRGGAQFQAALNQINLSEFMDAEYSIKLLVQDGGPRILNHDKNSQGYYYVADTNVDVILDPPGRDNKPRVNKWTIRMIFYVADDNQKGFRIDQFLVQSR